MLNFFFNKGNTEGTKFKNLWLMFAYVCLVSYLCRDWLYEFDLRKGLHMRGADTCAFA